MKLRCPPRGDSTLSCGRCLRLKVNCVNPPLRDSDKAASQLISPSQAMSTAASNFKRPEWSPRPKQHSRRHSSVSIELDKWWWLGPLEGQRQSQGDIPVVPAYSFEVSSASIFETSEGFTPFIGSERHESTIVDFESCDFAYSEDSPVGVDENSMKFHPVNPFSVSNINDFGPFYFPGAQVSSSRVDSDTRLSDLRLSLSKRCQQPRSAATTEALNSPTSPVGDDIKGSNSMESSWFGGALRDISEFLSIIEVYGQDISTTADHQSGSTGSSAIGVVVALDILLAYLQIVAIFDELCAQLYEKLRSSSHASVSGLQLLPGLQLAGLSVVPGHLQTKILIQAVVHHFEMIERVLGLPVIYRVSRRLDSYTGLLESNQQCEKLIAAVMEDECGIKTLNSLKQNLENMEQFIHG